jgi:hypothetical protein
MVTTGLVISSLIGRLLTTGQFLLILTRSLSVNIPSGRRLSATTRQLILAVAINLIASATDVAGDTHTTWRETIWPILDL